MGLGIPNRLFDFSTPKGHFAGPFPLQYLIENDCLFAPEGELLVLDAAAPEGGPYERWATAWQETLPYLASEGWREPTTYEDELLIGDVEDFSGPKNSE